MSTLAIFGIAFSLSMDAFAVSVTSGCSAKHLDRRTVVVLPLFLGLFQAGMPLLGWLVGTVFRQQIEAWDHWIAFILLSAVGAKMLWDGVQDLRRGGCEDPDLEKLTIRRLITLSVATSIDALVVGVSFSILTISIVVPVIVIGVTTALLCVIGVVAGRALQHAFREYAEIAGGIVLVLLGVKILLEHLPAV